MIINQLIITKTGIFYRISGDGVNPYGKTELSREELLEKIGKMIDQKGLYETEILFIPRDKRF